MKKLFVLLMLVFTVITFTSCEKKGEQTPPNIVHDNSIEYYVTSKLQTNGSTILTTHMIIFKGNSQFKDLTVIDTLPSLGTEKVNIGTDDEPKDSLIAKEYDIFFTIK